MDDSGSAPAENRAGPAVTRAAAAIERVRRRRDPAWYTPASLPAEFSAYDAPVEAGLGVGSAGKVGLLELDFAPVGGHTRVTRQYHQAPLYIYRPVYVDAAQPEMAFVYQLQAGDGLVQGDRYRVDIDCAPGAAAHVTTQAATKVFRAQQNFATQQVNLTAHEGSVLEYLPDALVPFGGSRLYSAMRVSAHPEATLIFGETLWPGRVAHGEAHEYDLYFSDTEVRRPDGTLLFADRIRLAPGTDADPRSAGLLGGHQVFATLYVLSERMPPAELVATVRPAVNDACGRAASAADRAVGSRDRAAAVRRPDAMPRVGGMVAGVSELPGECGAGVRILGPTSASVEAVRHAAWDAARLALLGAPAPNLRKG